SRQDEFGWDNYGPAHLAEIRGAVDANGKIVAWEYQAWGHDPTGVGTAPQLLTVGMPQRGGGPGGGAGRTAPPAGGDLARGIGPAGDGARGGGARGGGGTRNGGGDGGLYQIRISQNDMYAIPNR